MDEPRTSISWSANDRYLQNFANLFEISQLRLPAARMDLKLEKAFDAIHELYRMERPYYDRTGNDPKKLDWCPHCGKSLKEGSQLSVFETRHDELKMMIDEYRGEKGQYKKENFKSNFDALDYFFSDLTMIAVEKHFFPSQIRERTIEEKTNSLRGL